MRFADGTGNALKQYVEGFCKLGYATFLFCDSDEEGKEINDLKPHFKARGVIVNDCQEGLSIEGQVFKDVPWPIAKELVLIHMANRVAEEKSPSIEQASKDVFASINAKLNPKRQWSTMWLDNDDGELRDALAAVSGEKKWYKRTDYGEQVGSCLLNHYLELPMGSHLKEEIDAISNWIDA